MARIGYARVSTLDQDHAAQEARLKAVGCEIIRKEKASGKSRAGRDELAAILEFIRPGDELVVKLGRSTRATWCTSSNRRALGCASWNLIVRLL
jgi:DNA invertase Pin-like site-specific DNA recombinase